MNPILIGDSEEREKLREQQEQEYALSLSADFEKERLRKLMQARKSRVPEEPSLDEAHVYVSVRHTTFGKKARLFSNECIFNAVYDWIGSLSPDPEFFELKDHAGATIRPESKVMSGTFNMTKVTSAPWMSPSGEVSFLGFGAKVEEEEEEEGEEEEKEEEVQEKQYVEPYTQLQVMRLEAKKKLTREQTVYVGRETIYEDMLSIYKKRNVTTSCITIRFADEHAVGDGITRDAFSEFYQAIYAKFEGEFQKVPSAIFDEEDLQIIGSIIHHGFIVSDVFPLKLCSASLKHYLYGEVKETDLVKSFLQFIPEKERYLIEQWNGKSSQEIIDILSEYGIFTRPSKSNLNDLLHKVAKIALIRQPCFTMQSLVKSMGNFWKKLTPEMLDSLFSCCEATPSNVISALDANETCAMDAKVTTWLHRYIRSLSKAEISKFLRFITGTEAISPNMVIKVQYNNQEYKRPLVKTCFKILILSRRYQSFYEFKDNLNKHLNRNESWVVHDNMEVDDE